MTSEEDAEEEVLHEKLLELCVNEGSTSDVTKLLEEGANPHRRVQNGLRAIHYAAFSGNTEALKALIDNGARINACDNAGYTALHLAAKHGYHNIVEYLINNGATWDFCTSTRPYDASPLSVDLASVSITPLNLALQHNQPRCARALLQAGADPDQEYFQGSQLSLVPLENLQCLSVLLNAGACPDSMTRTGLTPLMAACRAQATDTVKLLLRHGANPDVISGTEPRDVTVDARTALHFCAMNGCKEIADLLVQAGASVRRLPQCGEAPLETAVTSAQKDMCKYFLQNGADPNELNAAGCSLLQMAVSCLGQRDLVPILKLLLDHGADPNYSATSFSHTTPSLSPLNEYFAYQYTYSHLAVKLLIAYGARVNMRYPTRNRNIFDGCGFLNNIYKIEDDKELLNLILDATEEYNVESISANSAMSLCMKSELLRCACEVRGLRSLSRRCIRQHVPLPLAENIKRLSVPIFLQRYLLFNLETETV